MEILSPRNLVIILGCNRAGGEFGSIISKSLGELGLSAHISKRCCILARRAYIPATKSHKPAWDKDVRIMFSTAGTDFAGTATAGRNDYCREDAVEQLFRCSIMPGEQK